ncbi:MAG TPA: hypothetical protein VLA05_00165 [Coriobacteriia bacterium]|nr:hypothetical protein [Coriobacteriia bacterium]
MRRLVAALLVAFLALTLVGCGGGGEEEAAAPPPEQAAPAPAPAPVDGQVASPIADRSDLSGEVFVPFPTGEGVPSAVQERLDTNQAMLLLFFNADQEVTDEVRDEVDKVAEDNRGLIDLLTYDVGKSTKVNSDGEVVIDEQELTNDPSGQEAVRFAHEIGVDHLPYIVIVDEQGYEIFWSRGFIDAELLDRQVERATP